MEPPTEETELEAGALLRVPDYLWGFVDPTRTWHPGACVECRPDANRATMLQGRGAERLRPEYMRAHFLVDPTPDNGLEKRTAFELAPRMLKLRPLALRAAGHTMGHLGPDVVRAVQAALLHAIGRPSA